MLINVISAIGCGWYSFGEFGEFDAITIVYVGRSVSPFSCQISCFENESFRVRAW